MKEKYDITPAALQEEFFGVYGKNDKEVKLFASPARINIIGELITMGEKFFQLQLTSICMLLFVNVMILR